MLSIQAAAESDVPILFELIRGLAEYEKLPISATEQTLRETLFGEHPYAEVLIARLDKRPIGYALYFHIYSTFLARPGLYLEDLFVVQEHRSKGVGRALLARVAQIAVQRHCARLDWSVLAWNERAISFYQRLGASIFSDWRICRVSGDELAKLAES